MKIAAMLNQEFHGALLALGKERVGMKTAYRIKKIADQINNELTNYNEMLTDLQKKHRNEAGEVDQAGFQKDFMELVNLEVEMPKINLSDLTDTSLTTRDLVILDPILQDDL